MNLYIKTEKTITTFDDIEIETQKLHQREKPIISYIYYIIIITMIYIYIYINIYIYIYIYIIYIIYNIHIWYIYI